MSLPARSRPTRPLPEVLGWRQFLLIAGLFWSYVTLSNVLYAHSFGSTLAQMEVSGLFAPWPPRVLQHLMMLVPLLACYWISLLVGWQPTCTFEQLGCAGGKLGTQLPSAPKRPVGGPPCCARLGRTRRGAESDPGPAASLSQTRAGPLRPPLEAWASMPDRRRP